MSHVAECKTVLKNLDTIEAAAKRLGGVLKRGVGKIRMYGSGFVDDSTTWRAFFSPEEAARIAALPREQRIAIINKAMNSAAHVIQFPKAKYDLGLIAQPDGSFTMRWDTWADGGGLHQYIGSNGGLFAQAYGIEAAKRAARLRGYVTKEVPCSDGSIKLEVLVR